MQQTRSTSPQRDGFWSAGAHVGDATGSHVPPTAVHPAVLPSSAIVAVLPASLGAAEFFELQPRAPIQRTATKKDRIGSVYGFREGSRGSAQ
jgi:hypothetical protein